MGDYSFYNLALFFALYENKNIIVPITSNIKKVQDDFIEESFCQTIIKTDERNLLIQDLKTTSSHNMIDNLREKNSNLESYKAELIEQINTYDATNSYYNNNRTEYLENYAREVLGWGQAGDTWYTSKQ